MPVRGGPRKLAIYVLIGSAISFVPPSGATTPIEPGVLDVQAWDWLQQDLDRAIEQTRARARNRLSPEAFEARYLDETVEFLEIDAEKSAAFHQAVTTALDEIEAARAQLLQRDEATLDEKGAVDEMGAALESRAGWDAYGQAQQRAVRHPLAVLEPRPRHQLLRENMLAWLLRLDYGMSAAGR
jgi:hypothetical protein